MRKQGQYFPTKVLVKTLKKYNLSTFVWKSPEISTTKMKNGVSGLQKLNSGVWKLMSGLHWLNSGAQKVSSRMHYSIDSLHSLSNRPESVISLPGSIF